MHFCVVFFCGDYWSHPEYIYRWSIARKKESKMMKESNSGRNL